MKRITGSDIQKRVLLFVTVFLALMGGSLFFILTTPLVQRLQEAENRNVFFAAKHRAMALEQWYHRVVDLGAQVGSRSALRNKLQLYHNDSVSLEELTQFSEAKLWDALHVSEELLGIRRVAADSQVVVSLGITVSDSAIVLYHEDYSYSLSEPIEFDSNWVMILRFPLTFSSSEELIGYDFLTFDISRLSDILENLDGLGEKSSLFLFHEDSGGYTPLFNPIQCDELNTVTELLQSSFEEGRLERDTLFTEKLKVIAIIRFISNHWAIVAVQDMRELYEPLEAHYQRILIVTIVILAIFLLLLVLLLSPITHHFLLREDELSQEIALKTEKLQEQVEESDLLNKNLQESLDHVSQLSGLIPICASCKKIRDDSGYWDQVETYISEHSNAVFSHGLCPECVTKIYPELDESEK